MQPRPRLRSISLSTPAQPRIFSDIQASVRRRSTISELRALPQRDCLRELSGRRRVFDATQEDACKLAKSAERVCELDVRGRPACSVKDSWGRDQNGDALSA